MQFHDKTAYVWGFAIDEPGSSVRALYATLSISSSKIEHLTKRRKADTKQKERQSLDSCLGKGDKAIVLGW